MALTTCKECKQQISSKANTCPHCGAKVPHTSRLAIGCAVLLGLVFVAYIVGQFSSSSNTSRTASQPSSPEAPQQPVANLTPQEQAKQEKQKEDALAYAQGLKWRYDVSEDSMGRGKVRTAVVESLNKVNFDFPYQGEQRGELYLRIHPKYGKDVILVVDHGQFLCNSIDGCSVSVRFGNGKPQTFSAVGPEDQSTTKIFLQNYSRFVSSLKKVNKVSIEAQFYQEGNIVFDFDVSGLKWP